MSSTTDDYEDAILAAISDDAELRAKLELIPEAIEQTVIELMPVDTGEAKLSVEVKHRRSEWRKLTTRSVKIGEIYSDDDPGKIQALEYGRGADDKHGATPEFAPFRRAAARWFDHEITV